MKKILSNFKGTKNELIPILQKTQEKFGYLSQRRLAQIATFLNITKSAVYGVVTFYSQFYLTRQGKYKIRVCQGTACHVRGGARIMQMIKNKILLILHYGKVLNQVNPHGIAPGARAGLVGI